MSLLNMQQGVIRTARGGFWGEGWGKIRGRRDGVGVQERGRETGERGVGGGSGQDKGLVEGLEGGGGGAGSCELHPS